MCNNLTPRLIKDQQQETPVPLHQESSTNPFENLSITSKDIWWTEQDPSGYIICRVKEGLFKQHQLVMNTHLLRTRGRCLKRGESIHHKNGIRWDNRLSNLELFQGNHPPGQRWVDLNHFVKEWLGKYPMPDQVLIGAKEKVQDFKDYPLHSCRRDKQGNIILYRKKGKRIMEHDLIMNRCLLKTRGYPLQPKEFVRHGNGDRSNNVLDNLELWLSGWSPGPHREQHVEFIRKWLGFYGKPVKTPYL